MEDMMPLPPTEQKWNHRTLRYGEGSRTGPPGQFRGQSEQTTMMNIHKGHKNHLRWQKQSLGKTYLGKTLRQRWGLFLYCDPPPEGAQSSLTKLVYDLEPPWLRFQVSGPQPPLFLLYPCGAAAVSPNNSQGTAAITGPKRGVAFI